MKDHVNSALQQLVGKWGRRNDARATDVAVAAAARDRRDLDVARCSPVGPFIS
jgi:hypothetical protein